MPRSSLFAAVVCVCLQYPSSKAPEVKPAAPAHKIKALLITGENNHDWEVSAPIHAATLEATGRFAVTVTKTPAETLADAKALKAFDVFVLDYNGKRWGDAAEKNFTAAVERGTGVVVIHAANNAFPGWKDYETICALCWRAEQGTGHGKFHEFEVELVDAKHPITAGLASFKTTDELYHRLVHMHDADFELLARSFSSKESGGTGRHEPMAIVRRQGKGRVFHTPLGHVWRDQPQTRVSVENVGFKLLLARGTEWAATGKVTITADAFAEPTRTAPIEKR